MRVRFVWIGWGIICDNTYTATHSCLQGDAAQLHDGSRKRWPYKDEAIIYYSNLLWTRSHPAVSGFNSSSYDICGLLRSRSAGCCQLIIIAAYTAAVVVWPRERQMWSTETIASANKQRWRVSGRRFWHASTYRLSRCRRPLPDRNHAIWRKGAITSKIKHAIKLKTSPARLAQLL